MNTESADLREVYKRLAKTQYTPLYRVGTNTVIGLYKRSTAEQRDYLETQRMFLSLYGQNELTSHLTPLK